MWYGKVYYELSTRRRSQFSTLGSRCPKCQIEAAGMIEDVELWERRASLIALLPWSHLPHKCVCSRDGHHTNPPRIVPTYLPLHLHQSTQKASTRDVSIQQLHSIVEVGGDHIRTVSRLVCICNAPANCASSRIEEMIKRSKQALASSHPIPSLNEAPRGLSAENDDGPS